MVSVLPRSLAVPMLRAKFAAGISKCNPIAFINVSSTYTAAVNYVLELCTGCELRALCFIDYISSIEGHYRSD